MEQPDFDTLLDFLSEPPGADHPDYSSGLLELGAETTIPKSLPEYSCTSSFPSDEFAVSTSEFFFPGADIRSCSADVVLLSSDRVLFYVHSHVLLGASDNNFNSSFPSTIFTCPLPIIRHQESSYIVNLVLHVIYDMPCTQYSPAFGDIISTVSSLQTYGVSLKSAAGRSMPLYNMIMALAPLRPMDTYILAATYDLHDVATSTSPHLLSFRLFKITDDMAEQMGAKYLKRLFFLHTGRIDALKRLLLPPPHFHIPNSTCSFDDQKRLTRAWALASAYLCWDARPDISFHMIRSIVAPLEAELSCKLCKDALSARIKDLTVGWALIKTTI